ncbi:hypothetical protein FRB95_013882 [Tulasnella sp. JGI-2019a]|nr:hypothetical protein FRB95_013882 [Tulasnella sp. JGI-2019a]
MASTKSIHANNNRFLIQGFPLAKHNDCPIWERALHDFTKVVANNLESVQLVTTEDHYKGDKVQSYINLNGRGAASLILRLINAKEIENQPTAGPSTAEEPEEEEEGQEVEVLVHNSDNNQDFNLDAPVQVKGKIPTISLTIPQTSAPAPPTALKPVTLTATAPKVSTLATQAPQVQTGSSTQGPGTSSTIQQPPQLQTVGQPPQQSTSPPPPPPPARQITATIAPAKAKWALPNQFTGKPDELGALRGKEFISSLNLYFAHYDNDYGGAAVTRTATKQKERVLFTLSLCTESAFPWADIYTSEFAVPMMDLEKEYIWDSLKSWEIWSNQFNAIGEQQMKAKQPQGQSQSSNLKKEKELSYLWPLSMTLPAALPGTTQPSRKSSRANFPNTCNEVCCKTPLNQPTTETGYPGSLSLVKPMRTSGQTNPGNPTIEALQAEVLDQIASGEEAILDKL